jgi:hypothetical protein
MKVTDLDQYNGNTVMDKAKGVAQSTLATVQGGVDLMQAGLARTQDTVQTGLSAAQDTWQGNVKRANKNLKKAQKKMKRSLASMQDSVQSGLEQTQDALQGGLDVAQDTWQGNVKRASKSLKKAQKKMKHRLASMQDSVQSGLEQTQDVLQSGLSKAQGVLSVGSKNVKRAGKGLQKATGSLKDAQDSVQQQLARYARRRKRAKVLFRVGLLTGIVLILLYAPWPGSDTRRQLGEWWKQVFPPTQG